MTLICILMVQIMMGATRDENWEILSWQAHYKICLGVAHGLYYLHESTKIYPSRHQGKQHPIGQGSQPKDCRLWLGSTFFGRQKSNIDWATCWNQVSSSLASLCSPCLETNLQHVLDENLIFAYYLPLKSFGVLALSKEDSTHFCEWLQLSKVCQHRYIK